LEEKKVFLWEVVLVLMVWLVIGSSFVKVWGNHCLGSDKATVCSRLIECIFVDVYTEKGGKGLNVSDGIFEPWGNVPLYAEVSNSSVAVSDKEVVFEVYGPKNPYYNFSAVKKAMTNASGIASTNFGIPAIIPNGKEITFGIWSVSAKASFGERVVCDNLTFEVGYVVKVVSVVTGTLLNETCLKPKVNFSRGEWLDVKLTVKSNAFTPENVWFDVQCLDKDGGPVAFEWRNFTISERTTEEIFLRVGCIHIRASVGKAGVCVMAWNGIPWNESSSPYLFSGNEADILIMEEIVDAVPPSIGKMVREPEAVQPYQEVVISVNVTDAQTGVQGATLVYYVNDSAKPINVIMDRGVGDRFVGSIPGFPAGTNVSYDVLATDYAGNIAWSRSDEEYSVYTVVPEFSPVQILLLVVISTTTAVFVRKKSFFFS
jgi:hypothetical protein